MPARHQICHRNQKQPWCKKCEIATVTVAVNIMIYRITHRPTEAEISVGVFFLPDVGQYVCISVDSGEAVKTKNLTMGAQYSKTYTDNQITDLEASQEDKQAQLSASWAEMNRWKKPLTVLWGQRYLKDIIQMWIMEMFWYFVPKHQNVVFFSLKSILEVDFQGAAIIVDHVVVFLRARTFAVLCFLCEPQHQCIYRWIQLMPIWKKWFKLGHGAQSNKGSAGAPCRLMGPAAGFLCCSMMSSAHVLKLILI